MEQGASLSEVEVQEIVEMFLAETAEGLSTVEEALVDLEAGTAGPDALPAVFRVVHTLKGNASSLGLAALSEFAHALEDVLDGLRAEGTAPRPAVVTLLLRCVDALRRMVPAAAAGRAALEPAEAELLAVLRTTRGTAGPSVAASALPMSERRRPPARRRDDVTDQMLRVGIDKLDRMLDLTGELAIANGRLRQILGATPAASDALEVHRETDRLFADLQDLVMRARMVPLGPVFRRYRRTVRDVAHAHGKRARLVVEGEDVEVDNSVVEHIVDPLTHMIRNSLDHGIETPETREAAGKDPTGTVTLRAFHEASSIVIVAADDGAGLDRAAILARARRLGLLVEGAAPSPAEVHRLIFEPGFSTAATVSELSGRGVGLDVVRRNVEVLRGSVSVESDPGRGTRVTLRLPLTLAIITGLNVGVDDDTFIVPLDSVVECIERPAEAAVHEDGRGVINLRGLTLPFVRLRKVFGIGENAPAREQVVVVHHDGGLAGLAVDVVRGESQAVIKPLGRMFQGLPGVSGATILGDGRVALVLDVAALLLDECRRTEREVPPGGGDAPCVQGDDRC